jgi:protein-export membrane protein SecD
MGRQWWAKFAFLMVTIVFATVYVIPTVANLNPQTTKFPFKDKINLGLDLQGGLYMVLGVDFNQIYREVVDRQITSFSERLKEKGVTVKAVKMQADGSTREDPLAAVEFDPSKREQAYKILKDEFWTLRLTKEGAGRFEVGIAHEHRGEISERTINQSIEVIRNRIDEFGVSEPAISSQGSDRIVVELPGVKDVDRAKDLIGRTAKLEFKIVNDKGMNQAEVASLVAELEKTHDAAFKDGMKFSEYVKRINDLAKSKIPADSEISFERTMGIDGKEIGRMPFLLHSKAEVTGTDLQDAHVQFDQENNRPTVGFELNPRGAALFEKLTGDHIGERLAIVLDNIVHSAPVIQSKIGGRGQITLGQGQHDKIMKEAKDLAIVLRAGALPARLEFMEQRVVGPSLGQDSIQKGAMAGVIGVIAVFLFVMFYYRVSGVIAVGSLLLNVLFVLAILVGLEATLTLPGIAGIALTVGIAVDSNVVIYERIREELRLGKNIHGAVESGFQKAFHTILDANVTNAAAAVVLMMYGTGPVKGFAVTMMIGIVTTVFTAVFVCKLIFDLYLKRLESRSAKTLSI